MSFKCLAWKKHDIKDESFKVWWFWNISCIKISFAWNSSKFEYICCSVNCIFFYEKYGTNIICCTSLYNNTSQQKVCFIEQLYRSLLLHCTCLEIRKKRDICQCTKNLWEPSIILCIEVLVCQHCGAGSRWLHYSHFAELPVVYFRDVYFHAPILCTSWRRLIGRLKCYRTSCYKFSV